MPIRFPIITIAAFILSGCPGSELATATDADTTGLPELTEGQSSTSISGEQTSGEATTGAVTTGADTGGWVTIGFDCNDPWQLVGDAAALADECEQHPFERADECAAEPSTCGTILPLLASTPACAGVTICDYEACADALKVAACDERPAECDEISDCLDVPPPAPEPNCCDMHGEIPGTGLCWASVDMFCVDCNGEPALCMTEGCGSANVEDCCLSNAGETVACPPPVCSPGFCDDFEEVGLQSGLDPEFAHELEKVCKWNPCFACGEVAKACVAAPCPELEAKCAAELATCDCG